MFFTSRTDPPSTPDVDWAEKFLPADYCDAKSSLARPTGDLGEWSAALSSQMTPEEKLRIVRGVGWSTSEQLGGWYVGNILAVPRLGISSIQMQDASQGFRTTNPEMVGQVTSWPCALAISAGWDEDATERWAEAVGAEFLAKGANVVLGPGVNVHRVALNGRNAEYLSGEDPTLGSKLAAAYVRGMQDRAGVSAVVKHFAMNEQESSRSSMDARVDERTRWEQYYPPFQAAVAAGVAAVMCSYNYVNGEQACSNSEILSHDLKSGMGFSGWIMSDWWALQNGRAAPAGTDQEQPGSNGYFSSAAMQALPPGRLEDMVSRVLHGMARGSRAWRDEPPVCRLGCDCKRLFTGAVATTVDHVRLARELAAAGAVLLKNSPRLTGTPTLPLLRGETVAVLGSTCSVQQDPGKMVFNWIASDYYVVGGSGRVLSPAAVSIAQGLESRGLVLRFSAEDDVASARAAMEGADVAIVCAGARTAENKDRKSLRLDQEGFIMEVLEVAQVPVIVVAIAPGAVVAPWRTGASAALAIFLSGQETGNAVADVLLGSVNPSGKLPVTFPANEEDAIPICRTGVCEYTERLRGGWHVYDGKNVAYPFGHGLSYTQFQLSVARDWDSLGDQMAMAVRVQNIGTLRGSEVLQLYMGFPPQEGGRPDLVLRGFHKTELLEPGGSCDVEFSLSPRDMSVWDDQQHTWRVAEGRFITKIGTSSRELKLCGSLGGPVMEPMGPC